MLPSFTCRFATVARARAPPGRKLRRVSSGLLMGLYKKRQRTLGQHGFTEIPNLSAAAVWGKQDVSEEELSEEELSEDGAVLK